MKLQIGIIGLGKFGLQLGKTLVDLGHEVLGVETRPDKVKNAQHVLTQVYQVDAMSREALEQIHIKTCITSWSAWAIPLPPAS